MNDQVPLNLLYMMSDNEMKLYVERMLYLLLQIVQCLVSNAQQKQNTSVNSSIHFIQLYVSIRTKSSSGIRTEPLKHSIIILHQRA